MDVLVTQNIFDKVVLQFLEWINDGGHWSKEFLAYFGNTTVASVINSTKPGSGYFMPACYDHTGNLCVASPTLVQGYKFVDILVDWY